MSFRDTLDTLDTMHTHPELGHFPPATNIYTRGLESNNGKQRQSTRHPQTQTTSSAESLLLWVTPLSARSR